MSVNFISLKCVGLFLHLEWIFESRLLAECTSSRCWHISWHGIKKWLISSEKSSIWETELLMADASLPRVFFLVQSLIFSLATTIRFPWSDHFRDSTCRPPGSSWPWFFCPLFFQVSGVPGGSSSPAQEPCSCTATLLGQPGAVRTRISSCGVFGCIVRGRSLVKLLIFMASSRLLLSESSLYFLFFNFF